LSCCDFAISSGERFSKLSNSALTVFLFAITIFYLLSF